MAAVPISTATYAQRIFATVDPSGLAEDLKFDTNDLPIRTAATLEAVPDLNFSPNIVFSPDSSRAFVSYPSSDKVLVFDPGTGEIVTLLTVGTNPALITLTPDGRHIAVVCLLLNQNLPDADEAFQGELVGSVSLINVETLEVRTLDLDQVFFSFFNNIVFSADSKTGILASSATDEIVRFDTESLTEITPRLPVGDGTRPSAITMAPDFSFFAVVLAGSSTLDQREVPDSIEIVDTNSFTTVRNIVPDRNEEDPFPHGFTAGNNLAISEDGKFGMIADQENSSVASFAQLALDHTVLLDLETGETLAIFGSGGRSHGVYSIPGTSLFVTIGQITLTFFEPESQDTFALTPFPADFQPSSRPAFTKDGRYMFLAAPLRDTLLVFDVDRRVLVRSIDVGPGVAFAVDEEITVPVPSAPLDIGLSPDEQTITMVNFNGNAIGLYRPTFRFISPQLVAQNVDQQPDDTEVIPPGDRFFSGVAISNFGEQDAEVILTPFASLQIPAASVLITANPNPIPVTEGELGMTTIAWSAFGFAEEVEIRIGSEDGEIFVPAGEPPVGFQETGQWVTDGMVFVLIDSTTAQVVDTVTVELVEGSSTITALPNPAPACEDGFGQTTISWDADELADEVEIRIGSADGDLWLVGPSVASSQTGAWVTEGMVLYLLDHSDGEVLGTVAMGLTRQTNLSSCPLTEILGPDEQINFTTSGLLRPVELGDVDGWLDFDSNAPGLAGIFLTFDGALNRLDGGPISSDTTSLAIFPETRHSDGFSTQIEVVNPNLSSSTTQFDLFSSSGQFVGTVEQSLPARSRRSLPFLGDPADADSVGLFDPLTSGDDGIALILALPTTIQVCDGELGMTFISWDVTDIADQVEVRVGSPDGDVLTVGEAVGVEETGPWVTDGMVFYLIDQSNGQVLDRVTVSLTDLGCTTVRLAAAPDPIPVCEGTTGQTTLSWIATDLAEQVEIRIGSADGEILTIEGPTGSEQTGNWVTDGLTFFLLNQSDGEILDTLVVTHTKEGCSIPGFSEGYIRAFTETGLVAFQTVLDENRMAVLTAQEVGQTGTHLTIPHFTVFDGSDTTLKLIHPSSIPVGGLIEASRQLNAPMTISLSLRGDDGSIIGGPLTLELEDGASRRTSVIDLFGLSDTGSVQSGWIDIISDAPGLLGSAEIQAFNGQALSAIPLQPARYSKFVIPHLAQGLGFSTGVAVVNSGDQAAQVTLELRDAESQLVGVSGPVTLEAGNRLVGTIPDLFPSAGELVGGTLKVLSDQPLSGVVLFYTDDLRVLSVVPSHGIE